MNANLSAMTDEQVEKVCSSVAALERSNIPAGLLQMALSKLPPGDLNARRVVIAQFFGEAYLLLSIILAIVPENKQ